MKIVINDNRKLYAIQEEFSTLFPYLKLGFFGKPHQVNGEASKKIIKHPSKTIGECRAIHKSGTLTITPAMTVYDLEDSFRDIFGLTVQLFRCTGNAWLETSLTDSWTLEEQNVQGMELSRKVS
jgi:hypothetical protein